MKNKNRKKSIIIAIVVVVLCLVGYKIADKVSYPLVRAKAVLYLADKYDAKISDFEMTDYIHSRFIIEDENPYDLKFKPKWKDFAFEFKYKDRKFIVNRYKGKFYDDYQLEDIEKWCSDWLKNKEQAKKEINIFLIKMMLSISLILMHTKTLVNRCFISFISVTEMCHFMTICIFQI